MCYSTTLRKERKVIEKKYKKPFAIPSEYEPYYHRNGFNHQNLYIIPMEVPEKIFPAMWGLVPSYGMMDIEAFWKDYNTLNAKSETVFTSNTYKNSIQDKRCLILADGFHEPHHHKDTPYPYFCHYTDDDLFCFAGLYTEIEDELFSCSILTMAPNQQFLQIHNKGKRQPLILDERWEADWLNKDLNEPMIKEIMKVGFTTKEIEAYPVSRDIYKPKVDTNNSLAITKFDYPELNTQGNLF